MRTCGVCVRSPVARQPTELWLRAPCVLSLMMGEHVSRAGLPLTSRGGLNVPHCGETLTCFCSWQSPPSHPSPGGQGKHDKITVFKGSLDFKDFSQAWGQRTG